MKKTILFSLLFIASLVSFAQSVSISTFSPTTVCNGTTVFFTASSTNIGSNTVSFQWQLNGNNITGATDSTYSFVPSNEDSIGCAMTVSNQSVVYSNGISITVKPVLTPSVSLSSSTSRICAGTMSTIEAHVIGGGDFPTINFKLNGAIMQSNNDSTFSSNTFANGDVISCSIISSYSCVTIPVASSPNNIEILVLPTKVNMAVSGASTVCEPGTVTFLTNPAAANFATADFQWSLNGSPISGATDTSYIASSPGGGLVSLVVSVPGCSKSTSGKNYSLKPKPVAVFSAGGATTFCTGSSVTFTAPSISGYTYAWLNNGANAGGGSSKVIKLPGNYRVVAKLNGCTDTSSPTTVIVNALPVAAIAATSPISFCAGGVCNLIATPSGAANYSWVNGTSMTSTGSVDNYDASVSGNFKVIVTDNNGCVSKTSSSSVKTKVNPIPVPSITANSSTTISATGSVKLNAVPSAGATFQWYKDGIAISGATIKQYIATSGGDYTVAVTKTGCTGMSSATTVTQTSPKENETMAIVDGSLEISAYPNPVSDILSVKINSSNLETEGSIEVIDILGKVVTAATLSNHRTEIDCKQWTKGLYFIRYKDIGGRIGTLKVVKE